MKCKLFLLIFHVCYVVAGLNPGELREQLIYNQNATLQEFKKRSQHEESPLLRIFEPLHEDGFCSAPYYPSRMYSKLNKHLSAYLY